ncbi:pyridine nucleotide-disulfide oxidoreductase [Deinococcus piscis]|uniref:Pyridine nucleotide-disulfide oxidoreductase n=1 Tax=Deinococcus piscis TaxID=394230 RepID=A0ABQ3K054_9DEIO|nr:NAD(P)/FAD-dependent oxidoreductase [Deinococcus piscis]GHF97846.1 pyridine nucleotide-disulfide oxidoreductase [Deinococcus piscis]
MTPAESPEAGPSQAALEAAVQRSADTYDAVIIGAGPAGLNAALVLGGARRRVLLLDGGPPRNARAQAAHGVFTRDCTPPTDLKRIGLEQLAPYDVTVRPEAARQVREFREGFGVQLATEWVTARRVLFASGVQDVLPHISGLKERWGRTVHHCPYCDGWPNREAALAVLGSHQEGHHLALSMQNWTDHLTLLTDGPDELTPEQRRDLARLNITLDTRPILRLSGEDALTVHFHGGDTLALEGMFLNPTQGQRSHLPAALGLEMDAKMRVMVNEHGMTSLRGVWAAGDMTGAPQYVMSAAASGMVAAVSLNSTLIHEDVREFGAAFHESPDEAPGVGEA